jgi:hypothetical protein
VNEIEKEDESDFNMDESSPNTSESIPNFHKKIKKNIKKKKKSKNKNISDSSILNQKIKLNSKKIKLNQKMMQFTLSPDFQSISPFMKSEISPSESNRIKIESNEPKSNLTYSNSENLCHFEIPFYCRNCTELTTSLFSEKIDHAHFIPNGFKDFLNASFINETHSLLNPHPKSKFICDKTVELLFDESKLGKQSKPILINQFLQLANSLSSDNLKVSNSQTNLKIIATNNSSYFLYLNDFADSFNKKMHMTLLKCFIFNIQMELSLLILFTNFKSRDSFHNLVLVLHSMIRSLYLLRIQTSGMLLKHEKHHFQKSITLCIGHYENQLIQKGFYPRIKNEISDVSLHLLFLIKSKFNL